MIRPGATITTDPIRRSPIDPSLRPGLEDEATPGRKRDRPRDGTNPISPHATERTRFPTNEPDFPRMGAIPDGTNPISWSANSYHAHGAPKAFHPRL
jgi:hypothetical protein